MAPWQRSGLGRQLVERVEALVEREASAEASLLLVAAADVGAFYERLGYAALADRLFGKRFIQHDEDCS